MFKTSFGIKVNTLKVVKIKTEAQLTRFLKSTSRDYIKSMVFLGVGTNSILDDRKSHLVVQNQIRGIRKLSEDKVSVTYLVGAGCSWDNTVKYFVRRGYEGLENLSWIPGSVGATPVQNVGAYGSEVKDTIVSVRVLDTSSMTYKNMLNTECNFTYRNSIFKEQKNKFLITGVIFKLTKSDTTINRVRARIIKTRKEKLPDVKYVRNCGSFFKNVFITKNELEELTKTFEDIPYYQGEKEGEVKIPTGYLLDRLGFKDFKFKNLGTYRNNALVLINHGNSSYADLKRFIEFLQVEVKQKTGLDIHPEPDLFE